MNQSEIEAHTSNEHQSVGKRTRASHEWFWFYF